MNLDTGDTAVTALLPELVLQGVLYNFGKQDASAQAAESHEVAVKPSAEGFANGAE